jgi:hypothetical protein
MNWTDSMHEWSNKFICFGLEDQKKKKKQLKDLVFDKEDNITKILGRTNRLFLWYETHRTENDASNNSSLVICVFIVHGNVFTYPLPSNDRGNTHTGTEQSDIISLLLSD